MRLACLLAAVLVTPVSADVWINEFHYDNNGADSTEGIEIVISPTTSAVLSDIALTLYNGATGDPYNSVRTLDTFVENVPVNGYRFFTFNYTASGGIQNGAPDGIALSLGGSLIQFLSYEGVFTGNSGIASGVLSTDVGVSESDSTIIGRSLQLVGDGESYDDFSWSPAIGSTFGGSNIGQTLGPVIVAVPEASQLLLFGTLALIGGSAAAYRRWRS